VSIRYGIYGDLLTGSATTIASDGIRTLPARVALIDRQGLKPAADLLEFRRLYKSATIHGDMIFAPTIQTGRWLRRPLMLGRAAWRGQNSNLDVNALAEVQVFDARSPRPAKLWDFRRIVAESQSMKSCRGAAAEQECQFAFHYGASGPDRLMTLLVVRQPRDAGRNTPVPAIKPPPMDLASDQERWVILIEPRTGNFKEFLIPKDAQPNLVKPAVGLVPLKDLLADAAPVVSPLDTLRPRISFQIPLEAFGPLADPWIIQIKSNVIDIYRGAALDKPTLIVYRTLLLSLNAGTSVELDTDTPRQLHSDTLLLPNDATLHVASGDALLNWDLNNGIEERARSFAKAEFRDLLKQACRMGHGRRAIRKGEWFEKTDRPEEVPVYACDKEPE
jgi:hypothetical protein